MIPGVSAGSKKVGAREKWTAQVIWPAGGSAASADGANVTSVKSRATRTPERRPARFMSVASSNPDGDCYLRLRWPAREPYLSSVAARSRASDSDSLDCRFDGQRLRVGRPAAELSQLGVQMVAQPVAHQVDRQDGQEHRQARKERDPPGGGEEPAAVGDHQPPCWAGWRHSHAQEAQRALQENHIAHLEGRDHQERGHDIGKDMAPDDPGARAAGHHRERHELLLLDGQRLGTYLPREARPEQERDDKDDVAEA